MSTKKDIHVVPHQDELGYQERRQSARRRCISDQEREKVELVIHRKDGTIQDNDSYGNDPFPPRDTKR